MIRIYPAIMGITPDEIAKISQLTTITKCVHIDVMDNIFVPNITYGTECIADYVQQQHLDAWLHLMIQNLPSFFDTYPIPEGALVSFHLEATENIFDVIKIIKEKKCTPSIAISPKTGVEEIIPYLSSVAHILVMSVNPGFSGQTFLPEVMSTIETLVRYRREHHFSFRIGVDGGVNRTNIVQLMHKGVDDFAISTGIFSQPNPVAVLQELKNLLSGRLTL